MVKNEYFPSERQFPEDLKNHPTFVTLVPFIGKLWPLKHENLFLRHPVDTQLFQHDTTTMEYTIRGSSIRKAEIYGSRVRTVLTEVVNDSNIQYLNTDDDDEPGSQLYVTQVEIYHLTCALL